MIQQSTEPEYILEEKSERMLHSTPQLKATESLSMVMEELRLLSRELDLQFVISGKILDSLHALVQSQEGQQ